MPGKRIALPDSRRAALFVCKQSGAIPFTWIATLTVAYRSGKIDIGAFGGMVCATRFCGVMGMPTER